MSKESLKKVNGGSVITEVGTLCVTDCRCNPGYIVKPGKGGFTVSIDCADSCTAIPYKGVVCGGTEAITCSSHHNEFCEEVQTK